ncbi:hypothetical protein IB234_23505 [Pseudomonas sp. PDM16]|uniref:hypothetical protein n=1 Tax=Pseudomonas sp. PDM16 TaxID=2769292 RepID=UPI00178260E2|nr:hypothetical protein [Pseudomonas sp. PDM16]MBD9417543.1 hypothetical protein [Pseudomonas sp. PDM16]
MCYMTIVSTTSEADLTKLNTPLVQFSKDITAIPEVTFLNYPNKWFIGSKDGCSCAFRHIGDGAIELGFSEPVDWWEEDQEDLDATLQVVEAFRMILRDGHKLDCIDAWASGNQEPQNLTGELAVNLNEMSAKSFRFFEGYRFELSART